MPSLPAVFLVTATEDSQPQFIEFCCIANPAAADRGFRCIRPPVSTFENSLAQALCMYAEPPNSPS